MPHELLSIQQTMNTIPTYTLAYLSNFLNRTRQILIICAWLLLLLCLSKSGNLSYSICPWTPTWQPALASEEGDALHVVNELQYRFKPLGVTVAYSNLQLLWFISYRLSLLWHQEINWSTQYNRRRRYTFIIEPAFQIQKTRIKTKTGKPKTLHYLKHH